MRRRLLLMLAALALSGCGLLDARLPNARVLADRGGLRLRAWPSPAGAVRGTLAAGAWLRAEGRTTAGDWIAARTGAGESGWAWAAFVTVAGGIEALPVPDAVAGLTPPAVPITVDGATVISGLTPQAHRIFLDGLARGNRADVFAKAGDSITSAVYFLEPVGVGRTTLGAYEGLAGVIDHFRAAEARDGLNPFVVPSLAAAPGWSTWAVRQPELADETLCQPDESPLACEYRVNRPAVALIMFGTNDMHALTRASYRTNLAWVVETSLAAGVLPVLSTIPQQRGYEEDVEAYNEIIAELAESYEVPLWDYAAALATLPDDGLSSDGVHPSVAERLGAGNFTPEGLAYGFNMRNLTALIALDVIWRGVLYE